MAQELTCGTYVVKEGCFLQFQGNVHAQRLPQKSIHDLGAGEESNLCGGIQSRAESHQLQPDRFVCVTSADAVSIGRGLYGSTKEKDRPKAKV